MQSSDGNGEQKQTKPKPNRIQNALHLPVVATYNLRSFFPKVKNVKNDIIERAIDCAFLSEIWEQKENKKHKKEIEKLLEMDGLKYISTPRPRGWGGAAILVNQEKFNLEKLNILIPHNLEIIWGMLRPKSEEAFFKQILVCSFYSPPKSRKNPALTDHIVTTLQMLKTKFPEAPIILGSDKNSMDIKPLLNAGLRLRKVVDLPTRQGKILSVIIMNVSSLYNAPVIIPPVPCDDPTSGQPSDHSVPVCYPHTDRMKPPVRRYRTVSFRRLPESRIAQFGTWLTSTELKIEENREPSEHAEELENILMNKLDETCPMQTMKIGPQDKPFITPELKKLKRCKQREYCKNGKSSKYKEMRAKFDLMYKQAAQRFLRNKKEELKNAEPGKAYKILKNLGAQPGDCTDNNSFTLPEHIRENLSAKESADRIAKYFSKISHEYPPLDLTSLPARVKTNLNTSSNPPSISEYECYKKIQRAKKPK